MNLFDLCHDVFEVLNAYDSCSDLQIYRATRTEDLSMRATVRLLHPEQGYVKVFFYVTHNTEDEVLVQVSYAGRSREDSRRYDAYCQAHFDTWEGVDVEPLRHVFQEFARRCDVVDGAPYVTAQQRRAWAKGIADAAEADTVEVRHSYVTFHTGAVKVMFKFVRPSTDMVTSEMPLIETRGHVADFENLGELWHSVKSAETGARTTHRLLEEIGLSDPADHGHVRAVEHETDPERRKQLMRRLALSMTPDDRQVVLQAFTKRDAVNVVKRHSTGTWYSFFQIYHDSLPDITEHVCDCKPDDNAPRLVREFFAITLAEEVSSACYRIVRVTEVNEQGVDYASPEYLIVRCIFCGKDFKDDT